MTRRLVLLSYAVLAATTQLLWLTYAAITTDAARVLHVDEGAAGDLAGVFPFVYIVLALPTGRWLDARFGQALGAGAALTALGALVRVVAPSSFTVQLAGQLVIAAGQPLVLNAITKVAARHFPPAERTAAISVGSAGLFVGILVAVVAGPFLFAAGGLPLLLGTQAVVAVVALAAMLAALRVPPAYLGDEPPAALRFRWLLRDRFLWALAALVFIGMGTYNGIATWLEAILTHFGEGAAAGGLIGVMTAAGIVGAAVLPGLAAARGRLRFLLLALLASAVACLVLALVRSVLAAGVALAVDGLLLMASLPVVLDWAEVHTGGERQGEAVGFLMLAGNLGGVVVVVLVQLVLFSASLALGVLGGVAVLGLPVLAALRRGPALGGASAPGAGLAAGGGWE